MKKKFLKIAIIITLLILTYSTIVSAMSFTASLEAMPTVAESTEFSVKVKVSNLDVGPNGINTFSGYLKYDNAVFETISESSIEGLNGWSAQYASDSGKITLTKGTFVKTEETIFNVTLKTKAGTSGKKGEIKFTNVMASNSDTDISAADISTEITVGTTGGNIANVTNTNSNSAIIPVNRISNNTSNVENVVNNVTNTRAFTNVTNETEEDMPYTGVEDNIAFLIIGIVMLAIVFYIKIERINKEMK